MDNRESLGNSIYVCIDNNMVMLTVEQGIQVNDTIYMDLNVIKNFLKYLEKINVIQTNVSTG